MGRRLRGTSLRERGRWWVKRREDTRDRNLQYGRSIGHFFLEHRGNTMEYPMFEARDAPADRTGHKEAQRRPTGRWT